MGGFLQSPMLEFPQFSRPFESGNVISQRFEIIREIGEGGMGVVYEAFDRKRQARIAIKTAKPGFAHLLWPELEAALRVRHSNVCLVNEIHSTQTASGEVDFLTMELLEGETLSARLAAHNGLCSDEAVAIAGQVCSALAEAHRVGSIHRDLKPSNIFLCQGAHAGLRAVITDFGLCGSGQQGILCGTPKYMAPELWLGYQASKASDLYALGVILHEMISTDRSVTVVAQKNAPTVPRFYSRLMEGCLNNNPEAREQAFGRALEILAQKDRLRKRAWFGIPNFKALTRPVSSAGGANATALKELPTGA